jgi:hypothetical protein
MSAHYPPLSEIRFPKAKGQQTGIGAIPIQESPDSSPSGPFLAPSELGRREE